MHLEINIVFRIADYNDTSDENSDISNEESKLIMLGAYHAPAYPRITVVYRFYRYAVKTARAESIYCKDFALVFFDDANIFKSHTVPRGEFATVHVQYEGFRNGIAFKSEQRPTRASE